MRTVFASHRSGSEQGRGSGYQRRSEGVENHCSLTTEVEGEQDQGSGYRHRSDGDENHCSLTTEVEGEQDQRCHPHRDSVKLMSQLPRYRRGGTLFWYECNRCRLSATSASRFTTIPSNDNLPRRRSPVDQFPARCLCRGNPP
jgi:hypothetical protein